MHKFITAGRQIYFSTLHWASIKNIKVSYKSTESEDYGLLALLAQADTIYISFLLNNNVSQSKILLQNKNIIQWSVQINVFHKKPIQLVQINSTKSCIKPHLFPPLTDGPPLSALNVVASLIFRAVYHHWFLGRWSRKVANAAKWQRQVLHCEERAISGEKYNFPQK